MNPSPPTTFESESYVLALVESESVLRRAQLLLQIADIRTRNPFEASRNYALAGMLFNEAAYLSMLGFPTGR